MDNSIFSALYGALSNEHKMNQISNNLANVNTTGYKKNVSTFQDTFVRFAHDHILDSKQHMGAKPLWPEPDVLARVRMAEERVDLTQGSMKLTGNPLDFAISGEGFFKVQDPATGDTFMTRGGNFQLNTAGQLTDGNGFLVQGASGPITIPSGGNVAVDPSGSIRVDGNLAGVLQVVTVDDPTQLEKVGGNRFRINPEGNAQEQPLNPGVAANVDGVDIVRASVQQGYLESANVDVVTEMVRMIETSRSFESYTKIMKTSQTMDQKLIMLAQRAM